MICRPGSQRARTFEALPEETPEQVLRKAHSYQEYLNSHSTASRKLEADLWTAAFFWKMEALKGEARHVGAHPGNAAPLPLWRQPAPRSVTQSGCAGRRI